ncbi:hypothetical protein ACQE3D_09205 [Methylomonas sp. MS20]|uniref:hypothetical protein n=1 Tax=unclassified Methylomonas TaxID=2608980 RepID=UPI0028A4D0EE|nr:hypothetical protein [Methylomonas sp. MV1]MDT4328824.1 hypothetical protein [Methylomonas sp. MV1]
MENHFSSFLSLSLDERRNLAKMGNKTDAFCRQTLIVSSQNRQALPPSLDMGEAVADLTRARFTVRSGRFASLAGRVAR